MKTGFDSLRISNRLTNKMLTIAQNGLWALILKQGLLPFSNLTKSRKLKLVCFAALFSLTISVNAQNRFWVASSTGNWNDVANWSTTSGGAGGASVPGAANTAVFNANGLGNCNLNIAPTVAGITINGFTSTVDLQGNTLTTTGINTFATGTVSNSGGPASLNFSASGTTTFSGTQINANITGTTARLFLNGSTFNGTVNITKTNNSSDTGTGGNIFNGVTTISQSGTNQLILGNTNPDIFNNTLNLVNAGTGLLSIARSSANNEFNGNVTFTYNNTGNIVFGDNGGTSSLANGRTLSLISCAAGNCGDLLLLGFTQLGTTAQTLTYTGTSRITLGPNTNFQGDVNFSAPKMLLNGSVFEGLTVLQKSGPSDDTSVGGNTFNGVTEIRHAGANEFRLGNTNPDIFNQNVSFTNEGTGILSIARNSANNQFNGNIILNYISTGNILFGAISGTSVLADGQQISIGTCTAGCGDLRLLGFTQLGATSQSLNLTGTPLLVLGPNSLFEGNVNFVSSRILLNGTQFNGTAYLQKTGSTDDNGVGGDVFNGTTTIVNSGNGSFNLANTNPVIFNNNVLLNNTGESRIQIGLSSVGNEINGTLTINHAGSTPGNINTIISRNPGSTTTINGNVFLNCLNGNISSGIIIGNSGDVFINGNITVSSTSGRGVLFGNANGLVTLGDGFSIADNGPGTFTTGVLSLINFTQLGNTAQNLNLQGTANLVLGPLSTFNGAVNYTAPRLFLNGITFNGITTLEKNGTGNDDGAGGNIFNNTTTIVNSGFGYLRSSNANSDIFNSTVTFTNTGSSSIQACRNAACTFNGNVVLNSTSGLGILFSDGAGGSAELANGFSISVGGSGFSTGTLRLQRFNQIGGNTAQTLQLTGNAVLQLGTNSEFDGEVNFEAPGVLLNGSTFNANAYIEKTGAGNNDGTGGNVFNGLATIVNSGDSYLRTGINNPDIFNDDLIVINEGASTVRLADNSAGNEFNGNIELNSTFGGGIFFGNSAGGSSTLAATRTISVGTLGVISGDVLLRRFTQVGATVQALNLTGIAALTLGPNTSFGGNINFIAPQLNLNGFTVDGTAYLEKTGAGNNDGTGGNIFNGISEIVNSGSGRLSSANTNPDIFETDVTVSNTGSNLTVLARASTGNEFKGNITFNSTLGSSGVYIASQAGASASLASGGSLLVGGLGFSSGLLSLRRFTQLGAEAQSLVLTGTGLLELGPDASFNGDVNFQAPQFQLNGTTFNGPTYIEKTGAVNNDSNGGNIFNGPTTIVNSGSGFFRNGISGLDQFNNTLTLTNTGSSSIRLADNIPGTVFNGNITVNNTSGDGIFFGDRAGGTATIADGNTITVGGLGFTAGELRIRRFTQVGSTAQSLNLSGSATLRVGSNSVFNANVTFSAPRLYLDGATYHGITALTKSGAGNDISTGGNTFNNVTSLTNTGSGYLLSANNNPDIFNGQLTLTNSGSNIIYLAHNVGGNQFNNNVILNATSGGGIFFSNNGTGNSTLANGYSISIGGSGFSSGELRIRRLTQQGVTAQTLGLTGSALLVVGPSSQFNGNVIFTAPQITLQTNTFNGAATITKTGAGNNDSAGGNIFNGITSITNSGTARFRLASSTGDTFNNNVTFVRSGSGSLDPAFNGDSFFSANVTVNSTADIIFGAGTGRANFTGSINQTINRTNVSAPVFRRLTLNKAGGIVTLNTPISISVDATFTSGILLTDVTNIPNFLAGSSVSGASTISHIDGPVSKTGNTAFTFPTGNNGIYRPASISAPGVASHQFRAQYFFSHQAFGSNMASTFISLSTCEYWTVDRTVGTSNVLVTLGWNSADCTAPYISSLPEVRVARWTGSIWENLGNGGTTGDTNNGTVVTSAAVTSFSPFTIASAAVPGDYRSAGTGNWNVLASWQRWNGTDWLTPTVGQGTPTSASGNIEIRATHTITLTANVTVDQLTVNGTLSLNAGVTLSAGVNPIMMVVNGTVSNTNGATISSSISNTFFNPASLYIHDTALANGGVVPTANWNVASTIRIALTTNQDHTFTSTSWSQAFGNVDVNIVHGNGGGPKDHNFNGLLTTINGNLIISNIGGNPPSTVILASAGTHTINVGGNLILNTNEDNKALILNGAAGTTTLNVGGNVVLSRGILNSVGQGNLVFNGSAVQNFTRAIANNTITGNVNCLVPASAIVDFGTSAFEGDGTFSLTGEMRMAHLLGLDDALQNVGSKTFNENSTVTYNGSSDQEMGTLYPATPAAGINVIVNKSAGTLSTSLASTIVSGDLRLLAGNMEISTVAPTNNTLTLNGNVVIGSGLLVGNAEAILTIGGAGSVNTINFAPAANTLKRLNINRAAANVGFGGGFIIREALNITSGTLLASSHTIQMLGQTWSVNGSSGGFVDAGTSTVIFDGTTDVLFGCDFHNINLLAGRNLVFPIDEVNVSGNINFNAAGVFTPNEGTINFMGGLTQNINADGHTFYNMAVDKTAGTVQINEQLNLTSFLNINSATAVISNGNLRLKSNNELLVNVNNSTSLDGKIGPLLNGGSVVGDVVVERHIVALPTGGNRLPFRYISSPVLDASWAGGSLLKFNIVSVAFTIPEIIYNVGSGGWKTHNIAGGLQNGEGYRLRAPDATDLVFTGEIASGEITWTFNNTNGAWFMIGNPYPSAIAWLNDIDSTRWEADNVSTVIGIYDNFSEGYPNYFRYAFMEIPMDGIPVDQWGILAEQNVIATGQAFWVYVGAGGGSLTIKENAKVAPSEVGRFYKKDNSRISTDLVIALSNHDGRDIAILSSPSVGKNQSVERFANLPKLWNEEMNIYLLDDSQEALLRYEFVEQEKEIRIPLGIEIAKPRIYTISFKNAENFNYDEKIYLIDRYDGNSIELSSTSSYTFRIHLATQVINDRFYLSTNPLADRLEDVVIDIYPNPVTDVLNLRTQGSNETAQSDLFDMNGKKIDTASWKGEHTIQMTNYPAGIYILKVRTTRGVVNKRIIKQ